MVQMALLVVQEEMEELVDRVEVEMVGMDLWVLSVESVALEVR